MKAARGWCKVAAAVGFLLAGAVAEADGPTLTPVAQHDISNNFNPEFHEASGLGLAKNGTKLWSVGDQDNFSMYKMELSGAAVSNATAGPASGVTSIQDASFEGVTYAPPPSGVTDDHYIYLVDEAANSIVPVNYNTNQYSAAVFLSGMAGYSSVVCQGGTQTVAAAFTNAGNSGLEGITWNNDVSSFFVLKEKDPGLLIQVSANLGTITATTSGVSIRHTVSFTSNADRIPDVQIRCSRSDCGVLAVRKIHSAAQSKKPARNRYVEMSIMPSNSTSVSKSTERYTRSGVITPHATISTAPSNAAAGRFNGSTFNRRPLMSR